MNRNEIFRKRKNIIKNQKHTRGEQQTVKKQVGRKKGNSIHCYLFSVCFLSVDVVDITLCDGDQ